ncbi:MAG: ribosome biogenesis GTPase Der [Clostridiales bacterium]|jgi:GTP-binding protein|nr:ribosome biogenesis GTPase Der [Clostridiales bacterium]
MKTLAIVGRPNVGKSTLFNKIAGKRISIVEDTPGVTRDRVYTTATWNGVDFQMIDTGGFEPKSDDLILKNIRTQAQMAIDLADVVIMVTDVRIGVTAADTEVARLLLKSGKPTILVCNKSDNLPKAELAKFDFYTLGMGDPYCVSSVHGIGIGDLLDEVITRFPKNDDEVDSDDDALKIAIVGKPNSGKSSLINKLLNQERVIVSPIAGTTRDSIDTRLDYNGKDYVLIDTAGMRKRGKIDENIEHYSVIRSLNSMDRADCVLHMIDATEGVTEQDTKIAGYAHDNGKPIVIAVNKWDAIEKDNDSVKKFEKEIRNKLIFCTYAPIIYISAKTGLRTNHVFEKVKFVVGQATKRVATGALNDIIGEATLKTQPPADKGKRLKIYYSTQTGVNPPTFVLFVNDSQLMHFSYLRYIENQLRTAFDFSGTQIKLECRNRS